MLLRTRITAMVATGLLLTALALLGGGWLHEQLLLQRISESALQADRALWAGALAQQDQALDEASDKLQLDAAFLAAVRRSDSAVLTQLLAQRGLFDEGLDDGLQRRVAALQGLGSVPLVWGVAAELPLLDSDSLERASAGDALSGLRLVGGRQALVLSTRRLPLPGAPVVLVLGRDVGQTLEFLARSAAATVTLLDLHGQVLRSTDASLWQQVAPQLAQRGVQYRELSWGAQAYQASSLPVYDLAGHEAGTLVLLREHTAQARVHRFLNQLALGGMVLLVLLVLLGVHAYLRRSLQPLVQAIDALQALAQGDTEVRLPVRGNDEVGRIAQAVARFAHDAQELAHTRALRERVRRRQERLLRTKLQALAQATQQPLELGRVGSDEEQLRQLAQVMNALSGRLIEQHQRLSGMVQELREALITKTRLAGLEQELQIAAQVQLSILPRHPPQDARLQLHCHIIPAREVGGDFYDYFFISPNALGFVIADVSGKGVPAALFMTITRTLLKATAQFIAEPTQCVTQLNDLLAAENEQMMFVTLFYGVLHLDTGTLHYVNAGHNPPYLLRTDGSVQPLARTGGMAVAVSEGMAYRAASVQLQPGEQLFLFTDGVTEAFNPQGQEFGEARLQQALLQAQPHTRADPAALTAQVLAEVHAFENGAAQADDITCMALRFGGPGTAA